MYHLLVDSIIILCAISSSTFFSKLNWIYGPLYLKCHFFCNHFSFIGSLNFFLCHGGTKANRAIILLLPVFIVIECMGHKINILTEPLTILIVHSFSPPFFLFFCLVSSCLLSRFCRNFLPICNTFYFQTEEKLLRKNSTHKI